MSACAEVNVGQHDKGPSGGGGEFPGGLQAQDGVELEAPVPPSGPQRLRASLSLSFAPGAPLGPLSHNLEQLEGSVVS